MTYNKDLQEDKEPLFDTARTAEHCVIIMQKVIETTRLQPEPMLEATKKGYLNATELADYLVSRKMPFREAHHLVGKIVMRASERGVTLEEMPLREYQSFSSLFDEGLYEYLDLTKALSRRTERGGTAPATVRKALRAFRRRVRT
jgi:argininosuccinate lyase